MVQAGMGEYLLVWKSRDVFWFMDLKNAGGRVGG